MTSLRGEACYGKKAGTGMVVYRGITFDFNGTTQVYSYHSGGDREFAAAVRALEPLTLEQAHAYVDNWYDYEQTA